MNKDNIFEDIDTNEKAYWLGVIASDGCVKNNRVQLIMGEKDKELVYLFSEFLGEDTSKIKKYGPYKTSGVQIHFYKDSKKIVEDLKRYEIVERKSKILRLPILPDEMYYPYLMGCFDGDGCQDTTCLCSGSETFLNDIKEKFKIQYEIKKRGNVFYLTLGVDLFRKMMESYPNSLQRKRLSSKTQKERKYTNSCKKDKCPICGNEKLKKSKRCKSCWEKICNENNKCPICGNEKDRHASVCWECYLNQTENREHKRRFNISKEELNKLINEDKLSLTKIGKMFGVSDNAIKKRAKKFGIYKGRQKNYMGA
jgi:hypothetical protein